MIDYAVWIQEDGMLIGKAHGDDIAQARQRARAFQDFKRTDYE